MESHVTLPLAEYEGLKSAASFRAEVVNAAVKARLSQEVYIKTQSLRSEIYRLQLEQVDLRRYRDRCEVLEERLEHMRKRGLFARIFNI